MSATQSNLRDLLRSAGVNADTQADSKSATKGSQSTKARTTKRKAPAALKIRPGHKELLDVLFDRITPFYLADSAGNLVLCSKKFRELAPYIFTDDGDPVSLDNGTPTGLMAVINQLSEDDEEIQRSNTVSIDGQKSYFTSEHFKILDDNGEFIGFGGIYEDVSALARANHKAGEMENWLQDVMRSSSDWLWSTDHNFNLVFVSPRISEAIGSPAQVLKGRHLFSMGTFAPDDLEAAATKQDMESHRPFRNRSFLMEDGDGETRYIRLSGVPIFNENNGRFAGYRGTGTDVTGRFEAEKSAVQAKADLETALGKLQGRNEDLVLALKKSEVADNAKIDFLAMMSHELRTPLNCIIGFSDAAIQKVHGEMDEAYLEYFANIHKAGGHLLDLINDILDTANIEASNVAIEPTTIRVTELVEEAINMINPKVRGEGRILSESDLSGGANLVVVADRLRARQILVNLIGNAVKFTPKKGKIGVDVKAGPNNRADITVWDTGIGIAEEELSRVFDRFYQVEKNILARENEGTGLGLSISRQLAQLMKGDLTVESTVGKGTRFTLSLPMATTAK
jgi:two-component system cell cycle sensor histidine kinase PleC